MFMSSCGFQNLTQRVSRRASLTAVARIPEVGGRDVELGPRRLDHAGGRLERPEEGAPDRHLDRDDVTEHVDPVQLPVNVGKQVAHPDDHIAQLLTPVALWPDTPPMPLNTPSSANRSMNPWTSRTSPSARWYARRTSASVSVVTVISHPGIDQGESRFTAGTVRGHHRIPVIVESCRPRNVGRRT